MENDVSFGNWLQKRRKVLDLTREEFAQKVGCSPSALRKIETDERRPSKQLAELLANLLEIPMDERETFIRIARGELSIERMKSAPLPTRLDLFQQSQNFSPLIPIPLTTLIGRETELSSLCQMLEDPQCRLVTITGMGGIGKTRLAIETANVLKEQFKDGAGFVPLAGLNSPVFLVSAIADALQLTMNGSQDPQKQLLNALHKKDLLLVLDNAENLLPHVGLFVEMMKSAPLLKLLVTSREQLNIQWEWVFELQGLPVHSNDLEEGEEQSGSVALFMQRARQVKPNLKFAPEDLTWIAQICRMVEGSPLAIELAAPWVNVLSIQEISNEIERHFDILESSVKDLPERHRSIRTTFNYSWSILSGDEKHALSRLSVFRGGFTREAAEQITGTSLSLLSMLKAKSWLQRNTSGRFYLHELVRLYAAEKLRLDIGEESESQKKFGDYYAVRMKKWEGEIKSHQSIMVLPDMSNEIDNIIQAWEWMILLEQQANISRSHFSLFWFHEMRGLYQQGIMLFEQAANKLRDLINGHQDQKNAQEYLLVLGQILSLEARWLARSGEWDSSSKALEESIDILRSTEDKATLGDALRLSGNIEFIKGNYEPAEGFLQESVFLCREASHQWGLTSSLIVLGSLLQFQGEYERSLQASNEAVSVARAIGEPRMLASSLFYQADVMQTLDRVDDAEKLLKESLTISQSIQDRWSVACALQILGAIAIKKEKLSDAVEYLQTSLKLFIDMGEHARIISSMNELGSALLLQGSLQEAKSYFVETIKMAAEDQLAPAIVEALIGIAAIQAHDKEFNAAYELVFHALNHPSIHPSIKERAKQLCTDLEIKIPPTVVKEIQELAQSKSLEEITNEILGAH